MSDIPLIEDDWSRSVSVALVTEESNESLEQIAHVPPEAEVVSTETEYDTTESQNDAEIFESLDERDLQTLEECCPEDEHLAENLSLRD